MLRAWKRWVNYVDDDNQKLVQPTANDVAAYLARISKGGPTAARGAYAALFRFATQMRLEFHLDDELVAGWRATKPGHRSKQQVSLEPLEIFLFKYAVAHGDEFTAAACAERLLCLYGVVRRAHIQRSELVQTCRHG